MTIFEWLIIGIIAVVISRTISGGIANVVNIRADELDSELSDIKDFLGITPEVMEMQRESRMYREMDRMIDERKSDKKKSAQE